MAVTQKLLYNGRVFNGLGKMTTRGAFARTGGAAGLCWLAILASTSAIASAETTQDFESWPTTVSWGTTMHEG